MPYSCTCTMLPGVLVWTTPCLPAAIELPDSEGMNNNDQTPCTALRGASGLACAIQQQNRTNSTWLQQPSSGTRHRRHPALMPPGLILMPCSGSSLPPSTQRRHLHSTHACTGRCGGGRWAHTLAERPLAYMSLSPPPPPPVRNPTPPSPHPLATMKGDVAPFQVTVL